MKGDTISRSALLNEFDPDEFPSSIRVRSRILQAPTVDAAPEWISVKDRLPKDGRYNGTAVLATDGSIVITAPSSSVTIDGVITHWMSLPEPPPCDEKLEVVEAERDDLKRCGNCAHWCGKYQKCEHPEQIVSEADDYCKPPTSTCELWERAF